MADAPTAKKPKLDDDDGGLEELVRAVWEHYRNYLDSIDPGEDEEAGEDQEADIDELQELIEIAKARIPKPSPPLQKDRGGSDDGIGSVEVVCPSWQSRTEMLPVLLSVAFYHLADCAISQYLMLQQHQQQQISSSSNETASAQHKDDNSIDESTDIAAALDDAQNLLIQSLEWYPYNAATWSMGANFGRMSQSLSLSSSRKWYEMAVQTSTVLRERALEALEDDSTPNEEKEWIEFLVLNQIVGVQYEDEEEEEGDDDENNEEGGNKEDDNDKNEKNKEEEKGDENDEEQDEEEADTGWYSSSAVESTARFMCAMMWSMEGRHDRALAHLKPFRLTHRLHPNVWRIAPPLKTLSPPVAPTEAPLVFQPTGGIIPSHLYDAMTKVFAPNAAYWSESDYSTRGYYSFFHEYDAANKKQPCNLLEEIIINHLLPRAQQCLDNMAKNDDEKSISGDDSTTICGFEWWTHTRAIQANLGHNLHFDTDESMLDQEGKVTHPMLSSVLYLTGGQQEDSATSETSSSPAGATIILDQTPDSETVGETCWQGIPKDNTFLIFPGNRLHGVLPCPGIQKREEQENTDGDKSIEIETLICDWKNRKTDESVGASPSSSDLPLPQRLTFMVGFWTRNVPATMKHRSLYGPCGSLPPTTEEHTWVSEITQGYNDNATDERPVADKIMTATALSQVSPAWECIQTKKKQEDDNEEDETNKNDPYPIIPHGIDHRFFVEGAPHCFRQSLFQDRETNH